MFRFLDEDAVRQILLGNLGDYSVTVDRSADRLAAYAQVKNTYLSTFQTLGSLGLMLGSIGLAVVLLRNLVERRAELALLTAIGFRRSARLRLVLSENAFLLLVGLLVGSGCALLGVLPSIVSSGRTINFTALGLTRDGSLYYSVQSGLRDVYLATIDPASGKVLSTPKLVTDRFTGSNGASAEFFDPSAGAGRRPIEHNGRPKELGRASIVLGRRPIGANGRSIGTNGRPKELGRASIGAGRRTIELGRSSIGLGRAPPGACDLSGPTSPRPPISPLSAEDEWFLRIAHRSRAANARQSHALR